jgi:hypothetical protein
MFQVTKEEEKKSNPVVGIVAGIFPFISFPTLDFCCFPFIEVFATRKSTLTLAHSSIYSPFSEA